MMKRVVRGLLMGLVSVLVALTGSMGVASADDTFDECISREKDFAAYKQLMKDGVLDEEKYPAFTGIDGGVRKDNLVQEAKKEHPDEFERLRSHYSEGGEEDSTLQQLGRNLGELRDKGKCVVRQPQNKIGDKVSEFWEDPVGKFAKSVMEGSAEALSSVMTLWIRFGVGVEGSVLSQTDAEKFAAGTSNIFWMVAAGAMVINVAIIGARLSWSRRQGLADGMEEAGEFAWTIGIYAGLLPAVIFGMLSGSDILAVKILETFGPGDASEFLAGNELKENFFGPVLMLLIAGVSFLGSVTQIVALAARLLIFPVLIGLLPLLAGSMATEWGKSALNSAKNWIIALLLYKPVAALIYVVAWWIAVNPSDDGWQWAVLRALMVGIAGFSIIPLAKVLVPAIGSMGGSNTGVMGSSAVAATGAVVGGAMGAAGAVSRGVRGAFGGGASGAGRGSGGGGTGGAATGAGGRPGGGGPGGGSPSTPPSPSPSPSGSGASNTSTASSGGGSAPETRGASNNTASPGGRNASGQPSNARAGQVKSRQSSPTQTPQPANRGGGAQLVSRVQRGMQGAGQQINNASAISHDSVGAEGHPGQVRR